MEGDVGYKGWVSIAAHRERIGHYGGSWGWRDPANCFDFTEDQETISVLREEVLAQVEVTFNGEAYAFEPPVPPEASLFATHWVDLCFHDTLQKALEMARAEYLSELGHDPDKPAPEGATGSCLITCIKISGPARRISRSVSYDLRELEGEAA